MIRRKILYSGRVQGVGFRATTYSLARVFNVSGTVRNLPDGRVELVAQGPPADVEAFLEAISENLGAYIHEANGQNLEPIEQSTGFRIIY